LSKSVTHLPGPHIEHPSSGMSGHFELEELVGLPPDICLGVGLGVCLGVGLGVGLCVGFGAAGMLLRHLHSFFTSCGKYPHWSRGITAPWPAFSRTPHATAG